MSKRNGDAKIDTTPKKNSRFSRLPSHKSSPTKEPTIETVTFDYQSVPMPGKARAFMGAYYLGHDPNQLAFASKCFNDDNKDKLLDMDHRFIGVYSLKKPDDEFSYVGIGQRNYAIKSFLFVSDDPDEDLQELLQMACDHYNSTAAKDNRVQRTAVPGKPHPVYDDNYNTLKEMLGSYITATIVAPWYETELKDGSFEKIQDEVVPIYFGEDADINNTVLKLKQLVVKD